MAGCSFESLCDSLLVGLLRLGGYFEFMPLLRLLSAEFCSALTPSLIGKTQVWTFGT